MAVAKDGRNGKINFIPKLSAEEKEKLKEVWKMDPLAGSQFATVNFLLANTPEKSRMAFEHMYNCMRRCLDENPSALALLAQNIIGTVFSVEKFTHSVTSYGNINIEKVILSCFAWYYPVDPVPNLSLRTKEIRERRNKLEEILHQGNYIMRKNNSVVRAYPVRCVTWSWNVPHSLDNFWPEFTFEGLNNATKIEIPLVGAVLRTSIPVQRFVGAMTAKISVILLQGKDRMTQYCYPNLVWTSVRIPEKEMTKLGGLTAKKFVDGTELNKYGAVTLTFPLESVLNGRRSGVVLGTKKYFTKKEYSQTILIPGDDAEVKEFHLAELRGVRSLKTIDFQTYKWEAAFGDEGWTHCEIAFEGELGIPAEHVTLSFNDHECTTTRKKDDECCDDCKEGRITGKDALEKFKTFLNGLETAGDEECDVLQSNLRKLTRDCFPIFEEVL